MSCLAVRDRFPEYVLGTLPPEEGTFVERHLAWCAACRKETAELEEGAALLGHVLAFADPPERLEDRVVEAVRGAAARIQGRKVRSSVAAVLAAVLALAGLGWGAVMAGRAERTQQDALRQQREMEADVQRLQDVIATVSELNPAAARADTRVARLEPTPGKVGGGVALLLLSRQISDYAFVLVSDLPASGLPYRVALVSPVRDAVGVGRITELKGGTGELLREFRRDIGSYTRVTVRDASGKVVLTARVGPHAKLAATEG